MIPEYLLPDGIVRALGWMLLHSLWQGVAVGALYALSRVFVKGAGARYVLGCVALMAMIVLPLLTLAQRDFGVAPVPPRPIEPRVSAQVREAGELEFLKPVYTGRLGPAALTLATAAGGHAWVHGVVFGWMTGVLVLTARLIGGGWVCGRLKLRGTSPLPAGWQTRVATLTNNLQIRRRVRVLVSSVASVPMVVGILRPVILVPASTLMGLTPEQLESILAHELAHIRRYDNFVNLAQRVVEALFFYHPAVWWVSSCVRTEREHCCDDVAASTGDPKSYVVALTALEALRAPQLAVAATGGSLLSRVRRLLGGERASVRDGWTGSSVASVLAVLACVIFLVRTGTADEKKLKPLERESPKSIGEMKGDGPMNVAVDVHPVLPHAGTTLASCLSALLPTVGQPGWTMARLQGVMGHAFQFEMDPKGGEVYHDNMDWGIALEFLHHQAKFRKFESNGKGRREKNIDYPAQKRAARDAVVEGLGRGVPGLVWQPMSPEQKNNRYSAYCWGLIVGYDEADETYTIRHPFMKETYTVRYDGIGRADGAEWFNVNVPVRAESPDERETNIEALTNAVAFANGTRYTDANFVRENGKKARPYGFAAYETWRSALEAEDAPARFAKHHANMLRMRRKAAAEYVRDLAGVFPEAAEALNAAAAHYAREVALLNPLFEVCGTAMDREAFTAEERTEARRLLAEALAADRAAVAQIEAALKVLES